MVISCQIIEEDQNKALGLLDIGCNLHMTGNKNFLSSSDSYIQSKIVLWDNYQVKDIGESIVFVPAKKNEEKYILHFFYTQILDILC